MNLRAACAGALAFSLDTDAFRLTNIRWASATKRRPDSSIDSGYNGSFNLACVCVTAILRDLDDDLRLSLPAGCRFVNVFTYCISSRDVYTGKAVILNEAKISRPRPRPKP